MITATITTMSITIITTITTIPTAMQRAAVAVPPVIL